MGSLTRTEAVRRAELLTVENYRIVLNLAEDEREFRSETTISFRCSEPGAQTFLNVAPADLSSIDLNGEALDPATLSDGRVPLRELGEHNVVKVIAHMRYSSDGEGLHRHVDPADGRTYLYAMSFLDAAPRWFACFDQPDLKATFDLEVHCPSEWTVIGNGAATAIADGHWTLATTRPLSTYFVTLVAGPYHSVSAVHDGIRLGLHARASLAAHLDAEAEDLLVTTRASFDAYHELFGIRYPFGEYHQAFVPDFNAGAMENPGCVTIRDQYVFRSAATDGERAVRANTIAHEMAHMWFGDLVTMRWWDDLWLNESFAEYLAHRVCAQLPGYAGELSWTEFGIHRKDWGYIADQAPSTHPVAGNGSADAAGALADFDGISYAKGASVLKQLAAHLGDEVFFAGLRIHFARHSFGNADFADLIDAWTEAGAVDLGEWARQWLRTSGLDRLTATIDDSGVTVTTTAPDDSRRPHTVDVDSFAADGVRLATERRTLDGSPLRLQPAGALALVVPDAGDDTWAKVRFGADAWDAAVAALPGIGRGSTRVVIYNAIRDAVRDAELAPARALKLLLAAVPGEPVDLVVGTVLGFATDELAGNYASPTGRPMRRAAVAAVAGELLVAAAAGSDRQLETARALVHASDDVMLLESWRAGTAVPDGVRIDAELRWALVTRLAELGALSEADIVAELAADASTSGVVHAARARAIRPDAEAKADAWALLTEPNGVSAYELYATADGFFARSQDELTSAYLSRYFDEMPATAQHRHGWALARVASRSFPVGAASAEVLGLAEAAIARPELDPGLRRAFTDEADALRRAVTALERFGE